MNWEERALVEIRNRFARNSFTASDAAKVLRSYSKGTIYRLLSDLAREGKITKAGYAIYRAEPRGENIEIKVRNLYPNLERARKLLSNAGIEFMLTGYSVLGPFIHLFPRRTVNLVYVKLGAGETAVEVLEKGGFTAILNPKSERELNLTLGLSKGDLFVIREKRELSGNTKTGVASIERGLVDLYFESTRGRVPFSASEVGRIMRDATKLSSLNVSRLTKLASRRGIAEEIRAILKAQMELPAGRGKAVLNKHVNAVTAETER
jgi:hypothetical protein